MKVVNGGLKVVDGGDWWLSPVMESVCFDTFFWVKKEGCYYFLVYIIAHFALQVKIDDLISAIGSSWIGWLGLVEWIYDKWGFFRDLNS